MWYRFLVQTSTLWAARAVLPPECGYFAFISRAPHTTPAHPWLVCTSNWHRSLLPKISGAGGTDLSASEHVIGVQSGSADRTRPQNILSGTLFLLLKMPKITPLWQSGADLYTLGALPWRVSRHSC